MKRFKHLLNKRTLLLMVLPATVAMTSFATVLAMSSHSVQTAAECKEACVALGPYGANPETVVLTRGSFLQFNSADGKSHNLSLGQGGEHHQQSSSLNSGEFKANEGWRVQFNEDGSYTFHDHLNPKVSVVVVVYTPGKDYTIK